jgi:hypothetical protein
MLRLESLLHILAWSKSNQNYGKEVSIDLIELPRLQLTFEKREVSGFILLR